MQNTDSLTTRWKQILKIAWPLIIANSFWNLQLTVDRIFLGMHSTESLGAAMAVMGVFWVPMALLQGTASYIITFTAQYFGAKEYSKIGLAVWQAIYVSVIGGLLFNFLYFLAPWFFSWVGHSPQMQILEVEYFNSVLFSAMPVALVAAASGFFTGLGDTKTVIGINAVGLVFNVILDYGMIFGHLGFPAMGVAGAGYATSIATYLAAAYGFYLVFKKKNEEKYKVISSYKWDFEMMSRFIRFGLPSGFQWALEGLAFTVFLIIMGLLPNGDAALSSSSIAVTVMMLSVLPAMGVAQAVMTLVGQHLGDKKPDLAAQTTITGIQVSLMYMATVGLSFLLFPNFYLSWFTNNENPALWTEVTKIVPQILKLVALFTIFDSIYLNISFALKGAGDTKFVSVVALIFPWPLFILPTYLLRHSENAVVLSWASVAIYSLTTILILAWRFKQGKWKTMSVIS